MAVLLQQQGDPRNLDAIRVHIHRANACGAFPGASKLNPGGETSPLLIPVDEVETWLGAGAPVREDVNADS